MEILQKMEIFCIKWKFLHQMEILLKMEIFFQKQLLPALIVCTCVL